MNSKFVEWLDEKVAENIPSPFKKNRKEINFRCPICGDSKHSKSKMRAYYYFEEHNFYCFNCDTALSGIKLLEVLTGDGFEELKSEYLKLKYGNKKFTGLMKDSLIKTHGDAYNILDIKQVSYQGKKYPLSADAIDYLDKRNIFDAPYCESLSLSTVYDRGGKDFIYIPWKIGGIDAYYQLNDFKKHGNMKYIFPHGLDKSVFGLDGIDISFPYVICFEGVYDSLFVKNGVAIGGKNLTVLQRHIIKKRFPNHEIIIALDNDSAGNSATMRILKSDPKMKCFMWYKDLKGFDIKDINEYMMASKDFKRFTNEDYVKSCFMNSVMMKYIMLNKRVK